MDVGSLVEYTSTNGLLCPFRPFLCWVLPLRRGIRVGLSCEGLSSKNLGSPLPAYVRDALIIAVLTLLPFLGMTSLFVWCGSRGFPL